MGWIYIAQNSTTIRTSFVTNKYRLIILPTASYIINGILCTYYLDLVTLTPIFGFADQILLKAAYSATDTSWEIVILHVVSGVVILSRK